MKCLKKILPVLVAVALAIPFVPAQAETLLAFPNVSLVKGSGSAVYYVGNNERFVFPNDKVYFSFYEDFSNVTQITDEELASIPIGGNITYRPGSQLIKLQTDPKVYAVGINQTLRWVTSEQIAKELYGTDWATRVHDVPDAFFVDYEIGNPILSSLDYNPNWSIYQNADLWGMTHDNPDAASDPS
ncbi:hypothetical protein GF380_05465, partial [Candidatus Uhrbacteria bacterium]|nr:hypothetical protein [Candidatus Uhrbacteria bacterium]MBD3284479.1 hypothetical protein [Candidatus Uhrbacteria bacterium]